jgi:hypothetical protein
MYVNTQTNSLRSFCSAMATLNSTAARVAGSPTPSNIRAMQTTVATLQRSVQSLVGQQPHAQPIRVSHIL